MPKFVEQKSTKLRPDGNNQFQAPGKLIDWTIRHYYSEHIAELKGDAEELLITEVHVYADDEPKIVYALKEP